MGLDALEKTRINHAEILAYKARILANHDTVEEYADWTSFLVSDYGSRDSCFSLGSGVGRVEEFLIKAGFTEKFDTIELSPHANEMAMMREPSIDANEGDLNFVYLEPESYDFVLCLGNTCERSVSYGGVYFPFVTCTEPEADAHMKQVVALDEKVSKEGILSPCYHMGLCRKSDAPPVTARPWSDKELRLNLPPLCRLCCR